MNLSSSRSIRWYFASLPRYETQIPVSIMVNKNASYQHKWLDFWRESSELLDPTVRGKIIPITGNLVQFHHFRQAAVTPVTGKGWFYMHFRSGDWRLWKTALSRFRSRTIPTSFATNYCRKYWNMRSRWLEHQVLGASVTTATEQSTRSPVCVGCWSQDWHNRYISDDDICTTIMQRL